MRSKRRIAEHRCVNREKMGSWMISLVIVALTIGQEVNDYKLNTKQDIFKDQFSHSTENSENPSLPIDSSVPLLLTRIKRRLPTCYGSLACYCYNRATQRHFCCKCIDDTCFPEDATVQLEDGYHLQMKDLRLGHRILSTDLNTGNLIYSPVIAFLDRRPKKYGTYIGIKTESKNEIYLSGSHLIFTTNTRGNENFTQETFADKLIRNDAVFVTGNSGLIIPAIVTEITREIKKGAFVPLTESGTLFVDGILASCYASVSHHSLAHSVLLPVRLWPHLFETEESQLIDGVRNYVLVLKFLARWILPTSFTSLFAGGKFLDTFTNFPLSLIHFQSILTTV